MSELGDDPREVLATYRRSTRIDAAVRERAWARVQTTLEVPGAPTMSVESARGLQTLTWVASIAAAAAIALVARGHLSSETAFEADGSAPMQASDRAPTALPELVEDTAGEGPPVEPPEVAPEVDFEVAPEVAPDRPKNVQAPTPQHRSRPTRVEPTGGDLAREMQLLRDTRAALQREDSESALRHLDIHAREFPQGQMAEERDYLSVEALCVAGYDERARQAADAFSGKHPASTHLDRVRAACSK